MTTVSEQNNATRTERRFFLWMAGVFAATVVWGFSINFLTGRVKAETLPGLLYLHALAFGGWITLYLIQCVLVDRGSIALHRRLGWFGAALSAAMIPLGILTTTTAMSRGMVPFFFPKNIFLVIHVMATLAGGALVAAAVALRGRPGWHRRLMYCAALEWIAPAFGRILPMPVLGPWGPHLITGMLLLYAAIGILFDFTQHRRVHPGWWWGVGTIIAVHLSFGPIAFSPPVRALAEQLAHR